MITNYYRDHDGWNGKTTLDIEDGRTLVIRTSKRSIGGGLATSVTAWRRNEDGSNRHVMGFGLGEGDYSERVMLSMPSRITEKLVRQQHETTLTRIGSIRADVRDYYEAQERRPQAREELENSPDATFA